MVAIAPRARRGGEGDQKPLGSNLPYVFSADRHLSNRPRPYSRRPSFSIFERYWQFGAFPASKGVENYKDDDEDDRGSTLYRAKHMQPAPLQVFSPGGR